MRTTLRVVAAVIVAAASGASAGERPTVEEILTACQKSFEKLARVKIELTDRDPKQAAEGGSDWTREMTILRDSSRWKLDEVQRGTRAVEGKPVAAGFWHQTLIGDEIIVAGLHSPPPQDPGKRPILTAFRDNHSRRVWTRLYLASTLFGYIPGDGGLPLWTVMGEDTTLELLPEPEKIADVETWVVKSRGKYGEHKVWFDPASGGLPRRIEVRKQIGNLYNDEQLGSRPPEVSVATRPKPGEPRPGTARQDVYMRIDNIQIEKMEGIHLIMAFDEEYRCKYVKTQKEIERRRKLRVRSFDVDPNPWGDDAFQFDIQIPNRHPVGIFSNLPLEFGDALADSQEEWIDGKLQKRPGQ